MASSAPPPEGKEVARGVYEGLSKSCEGPFQAMLCSVGVNPAQREVGSAQ